MANVIDFILHVDKYINVIIQNYGAFTYLILFIIILLETGLVITPFLPGDSLLFVVGAFAAQGAIDIIFIFILLSIAAIIGDSMNYAMGSYFGVRLFKGSRLFKEEYLEKTKSFYQKYGGKTIIIARFIPIVRTFAPFVAGIGRMYYPRFLAFNIIGGLAWISLFLFAGYFFGTLPIIKENLTIVILIIIFLSILPPIIEYIRIRRKAV